MLFVLFNEIYMCVLSFFFLSIYTNNSLGGHHAFTPRCPHAITIPQSNTRSLHAQREQKSGRGLDAACVARRRDPLVPAYLLGAIHSGAPDGWAEPTALG